MLDNKRDNDSFRKSMVFLNPEWIQNRPLSLVQRETMEIRGTSGLRTANTHSDK